MSEAIRVDDQVSERLTWKQICERYPDEWVVLDLARLEPLESPRIFLVAEERQ
jgi:hypothetical protein